MQKNMFDGEDPKLAFKRIQIQAETQLETQVYTQLQDGQVPSFEKFMATKKKIQKSNKGA